MSLKIRLLRHGWYYIIPIFADEIAADLYQTALYLLTEPFANTRALGNIKAVVVIEKYMSDTIFIYLIVSSLTKKQREVRYLH
jgi:hypothetical protein